MNKISFWGLPTVDEIKEIDSIDQVEYILDLLVKVSSQDGYINEQNCIDLQAKNEQRAFIADFTKACQEKILELIENYKDEIHESYSEYYNVHGDCN